MCTQISKLGQTTSFAFADLGLSADELALIAKLKFDLSPGTNKNYDRFGDLHLLVEELPNYLRSIGNDDKAVIQAVTDIIYRTAQNVLLATDKPSAWVTVRATTPNHEFDLPRWHMDGKYYDLLNPNPEMLFKFAAVLKGRPTLLYHLTPELRTIFNAHWTDRVYLSKLLDINSTVSPQKGQGVFFIVGDTELGAAHSEPKMDTDRLFFSVLIGTEANIAELFARFHPK